MLVDMVVYNVEEVAPPQAGQRPDSEGGRNPERLLPKSYDLNNPMTPVMMDKYKYVY